jgi:hypothetical protein
MQIDVEYNLVTCTNIFSKELNKMQANSQDKGPLPSQSSGAFSEATRVSSGNTAQTVQDNWRVDYLAISMQDQIGCGGFGVVYKAKFNFETVAVKQLHPFRFSKRAVVSFQHEASLMMTLVHPRVLIYRGFFEEELNYGIVMEYMEGGSMIDHIEGSPEFPEQDKLTIANDVALGLNYLHFKNVCHRKGLLIKMI